MPAAEAGKRVGRPCQPCQPCVAVVCCAGLMTIEKGVPNLTGLFSLQNVTPIHVAPAGRAPLTERMIRLCSRMCGCAGYNTDCQQCMCLIM